VLVDVPQGVEAVQLAPAERLLEGLVQRDAELVRPVRGSRRAEPHGTLRVLAYTAAELLALLPFTPGGLGFVEAGLVGTLTLASVPGSDALAATLLYRLAAYWLPIPAGGVAYLLFRHRYH
jgi:hypothetical protein